MPNKKRSSEIVDAIESGRTNLLMSTRAFSDIGGLMSFGADGPAAVRHGAKFVQRILQGKGPKDIPVEQPTKYELAINLRTAKALGINIPDRFMQRVDVIIE
ncbi:MAG: ABC transporter substrate binding protein [Pseudolabrys sp.]